MGFPGETPPSASSDSLFGQFGTNKTKNNHFDPLTVIAIQELDDSDDRSSHHVHFGHLGYHCSAYY